MLSQVTVKPVPRKSLLIGLDRDGTINRDLGTYCYKEEDFEILPGVIDAIKRLKRAGHTIAIITNQGGIEKGLYTEIEVKKLHAVLQRELLIAKSAPVDALFYSPSSKPDFVLAKPNPTMLQQAELMLGLRFSAGGFYVGDAARDLIAAERARATAVLVKTGKGQETLAKLDSLRLNSYPKIFETLLDFAKWLVPEE